MFKILGELNQLASRMRLLTFPVGFVFTVREEYWRDWESIFEGQRAKVVKNTFSEFNHHELDQALGKYSTTYSYFPISRPSHETRRVLSIPFNLLVFSEANELGVAILERRVTGAKSCS
jgi:hypothetical protein